MTSVLMSELDVEENKLIFWGRLKLLAMSQVVFENVFNHRNQDDMTKVTPIS